MKIQKYSYLPTGHSHSINFGLGIHLDTKLQSHVVSLFALNDNGGAPLCKYLPEVCLDVLEQCGGTPHKGIEDFIWTYSAGNVTSRLNFSTTANGLVYHVDFNNPHAYIKELKAGVYGEGDFLWPVEEYEIFYNREAPLQVAKRDMTPLAESRRAMDRSFYLVPSLSGEFAKHHLFTHLIHADLFQTHISTRFFLADATKLVAALRNDEDVIHLRNVHDKSTYVGKVVEGNSPKCAIDFGLWSYSSRFNALSFVSGNSLAEKCGEGLSVLVDRLGLPFIPAGIVHDDEVPQVEEHVRELAYGDKPIYLNNRGPVIE